MHTNKTFALATLALIAAAVPSANGASLTDDFSLPTPASTVQILNDPNPHSIVTALPGGTTRTATFHVLSAVIFNSLSGGIGGGMLAAGFNAVSFGEVVLNYSFASARDFSADGLIELVSAGSAGVGANFVIQTSTGNLTLNSVLPTLASFTPTQYLFSSFAGTGNLTQVTGLELRLPTAASASFLIDSISVLPTPEPGSALLLALPVLAILRRRQN